MASLSPSVNDSITEISQVPPKRGRGRPRKDANAAPKEETKLVHQSPASKSMISDDELARWEEQHKSDQNKKKRQRRFQEAEEKLRKI